MDPFISNLTDDVQERIAQEYGQTHNDAALAGKEAAVGTNLITEALLKMPKVIRLALLAIIEQEIRSKLESEE